MNYIKADSIEAIISFINKYGIAAKQDDKPPLGEFESHPYDRDVYFTIYGIEYRIHWYVNVSTLYIGRSNRAAGYPFKFIEYNTTMPLVGGNVCLKFNSTIEDGFLVGKKLPYESFYIPLEIK